MRRFLSDVTGACLFLRLALGHTFESGNSAVGHTAANDASGMCGNVRIGGSYFGKYKPLLLSLLGC